MDAELLFKWKTNLCKMGSNEFRLWIRRFGIFRAMRLLNNIPVLRAGSPSALKVEPDQFIKVLIWCSCLREQETKLQKLSNSVFLFNVSLIAYSVYTVMYSFLHSVILHWIKKKLISFRAFQECYHPSNINDFTLVTPLWNGWHYLALRPGNEKYEPFRIPMQRNIRP